MITTQTWKIGDCLELLPEIETGSIDLIITDLPYGSTSCVWDSIIPFEPLWEQYKRIIKDNGAIVLTASQPFTSVLIVSNLKMFKYCWTWNKVTAKGHLVAKIRPMQQTEDIAVFGKGRIKYFPIMERREKTRNDVSVEYSRSSIVGGKTTKSMENIERKYRYQKPF